MTRPQRFKTGVQLYGNLTRKQLANLVRLRTGHCRLNSYLNRHNIIEDPSCDCGCGIETVKHFLLLCKKYEESRNELQKKVGQRNMRMENLLGDPKLVKDTLCHSSDSIDLNRIELLDFEDDSISQFMHSNRIVYNAVATSTNIYTDSISSKPPNASAARRRKR